MCHLHFDGIRKVVERATFALIHINRESTNQTQLMSIILDVNSFARFPQM